MARSMLALKPTRAKLRKAPGIVGVNLVDSRALADVGSLP